MKALRLSPDERMASLPSGNMFRKDDATLRVMIEDCEWLSTAFLNELVVHAANRQRDELAAAGHSATNSR